MTSTESITTGDDKAMETLLADMANRGFTTPTLTAVKRNINKGSYDDFAKALANSLNINYENTQNDTRLFNYINDLSIDITSQYGARKQQLFINDLKFNWFRYIGSNLTTTRPFCLAMTEKDFFHRCEIPSILEGNFPEFQRKHDPLYDEAEIPSGFYSNTNENNFLIYRGGYGCGHVIMAIPDSAVPENIKMELYNQKEYENWILNNTKQTK